MNCYPKHPDISTAQLAADYATGDSLRTIGHRYGISHAGVAWRLKEAGITLRTTWSRRALAICPSCGCSFRPRPQQKRCSEGCWRAPHAAMCKRGHPLTPENLTPRYGHCGPRCRQCLYASQARYRERKKPWEPKST